MSQNNTCIHASTIAWRGSGLLILGASGTGKSTLALQLMAFGCDLVADDQTALCVENQQLIARSPTAIRGQIEARRFGILNADTVPHARISCAVDLNQSEDKRLPQVKHLQLCGRDIRLFHNPGIEVLPFAVLQYLKASTA